LLLLFAASSLLLFVVGLSCSVVVGVGVLFANGCGAMLKRNRNGMPNDDDDDFYDVV